MGNLVEVLQVALGLLTDAPRLAEPILNGGEPADDEARDVMAQETVPALLEALRAGFADGPWERDALKGVIKTAGKTAGAKGKNLFMPLRVKLTGACHGPDLVGIIHLLGREEVLARLSR